jgi:cytochrome c
MKLTGSTRRITLGGSAVRPIADSNSKPELRSYPQIRSRILKHASLAAFSLAMVVASESQAQETDGERLFRQRCSSCHSLETGQNRTGPSLAAVNGRAAGSVEGARYSPALRDSTVVWNAETLDRFLASPRQFLPGTTMTMGVTNEAQRRALVDFLTASR